MTARSSTRWGGDDRFNLKTGRDGGHVRRVRWRMLGDMVMYRVEPDQPERHSNMIIVNEMNKMAGMEEGTEFPVIDGRHR